MTAGLSLNVPSELVQAIAAEMVAQLDAKTPAPAALPVKAGRMALTKAEAAEALGISVDHLERHVLRDVKVVRSGRLRLIPTTELEAWLERNAARLGEWR
jgi:excisionase family DNA binding protein